MSTDTQKQLEYIAAILGLMAQEKYLESDDPLSKALSELMTEQARTVIRRYTIDRQIADHQAPEGTQRKEFEKLTKHLAKALPGITSGTLAAVAAYQKGDAITGSAAVMDICASLAPMLGAASTAGGPPGMLVGAIFAMIGQILKFFAPQSESLTTQIEGLLRGIQAEGKAQQIGAVHTDITNYATSLRDVAVRVQDTLNTPTKLQIFVVTDIIKDFKPIGGTTMRDFWQVAEWLQEKKNQDLDEWPTILAAVCQAYSDLLLSVVTLFALLNSDAMTKCFNEAERTKDQGLQDALTRLLAKGTARLIQYGSCNNAQLNYLKRAVSAARDRGMLWQLEDSTRKPLWAGTSIRKGEFTYLGGEQKRIGVAVTRQEINSPERVYHVFSLENDGYSRYDRTYHGVVKSPYKVMKSVELTCTDFSLSALHDIWATPGLAHNGETDILLYAARGNDIRGFVVNSDNMVRQSYARVLNSKANSVRVVHLPSYLEDDPDADVPDSGSARLDYITYGGLEASAEVYVDAAGKEGYVRSPWGSYSGVRVDQHYLWVFGSGGFACATHASVVRCLNGKSQRPRWMIHYPNELLYTNEYHWYQNEVNGWLRTPLLGLVDLSPCDDGTLVVALYTRSVNRMAQDFSSYLHSFSDANALYSGVYHVDLKRGNLSVEWTKLGNATGVAVHKTPIFCWPVFESLMTSLQKYGPALKQIDLEKAA